MKTRSCFPLAAVLVAACAPALTPSSTAAAAKATSDIVPPARRQLSVEMAERLTRPPTPAPLPADLPPLFNPPDFDKPDADELKLLQASGKAPAPSAGSAAAAAPGTAAPAGPATDRDILDHLAARIPSTGTIVLGGKPLLIVGGKRLEIGTKFTVSFNNQDYELELVAIDRTTFTLRYRGEEVTRPIRNR